MIEHRYVVARNDWIVQQLLKKIYNKRLIDYDQVLHKSMKDAVKVLQKKPFGVQEIYDIFKVQFDRDQIIS